MIAMLMDWRSFSGGGDKSTELASYRNIGVVLALLVTLHTSLKLLRDGTENFDDHLQRRLTDYHYINSQKWEATQVFADLHAES